MDTTSKPEILIVDDELDACYLLVNMLNNKRIKSVYANSLKEAEEVLKAQPPGVILLDNNLKDGSGINFISDIKRYSPHSKIIVISANDTEADRRKALLNGADSFIGKPFTRDVIYQTIGRLNPSIMC